MKDTNVPVESHLPNCASLRTCDCGGMHEGDCPPPENCDCKSVPVEESSDFCLQCGESIQAIRLHRLGCAVVSDTECGRETSDEWERHRFRPYTEKELEAFRKEEEYWESLGKALDN